jgi:hypothetical protein
LRVISFLCLSFYINIVNMSDSIKANLPLVTAKKLEFPIGSTTMTPYMKRKLENLQKALSF